MSFEIKEDGTAELTIVREFNYPPEAVFEAWLNPKYLSQWMGPTDEINVSNISINAEEGGNYHMQFNEPKETNKLNGVYKIIERYTRLVFSWIWEPPTDGANEETLVTLKFEPTINGTKLTLLHQKFSSQELCERHLWGWNETLNKFDRLAVNFLTQ